MLHVFSEYVALSMRYQMYLLSTFSLVSESVGLTLLVKCPALSCLVGD